jgi:SNF2 family DNA or RNA helicase
LKYLPHQYQQHALSWLIEKTIVQDDGGAALFLDPGLGKTSTTLAWLRLLSKLSFSKKTLIVAPLRVIYSVWPRECEKWDQFRDLRCSIIHGSATQRMAAIATNADLYLINPEGVVWLEKYFSKRELPFETLVVDESSRFKNWSAKRTKALRKLVPRFDRRVILTGTPSPNSLEDLFSQVFIVDQGKALGTSITKFRELYFYRGGFGGYAWKAHEGSTAAIEAKISGMCLRLSAEDHLDMPALLINDVWVDLPSGTLAAYKKLEREMFLALGEGKELLIGNAGTKYLACRQLANGGIYDADKKPVHLHGGKIDAVVDLVEELQGKPALIAFQFKHDLERLRKAFPKIPSIDGRCGAKEADKLIERWNEGELPLLAVQPQSLSHGINMQAGPGRDIVWLGLTDNLETYLQLNARIHRQGVTGQVRVHRILANRTVDKAIADRIESKDQNQSALLEALNKYRKNEERA